MGWVLIGVGRKREGEMWCGFEGDLNEIGWRVEEEERARAAWVAAEEEKRARARLGVQMQLQARRREVVEID
jgi:hypothetical protein